MLHKLVDKVYAVSLPSSRDRQKNIAEQCHKIGTRYYLWPAIDGRKADVEWYENQYAKDQYGWTQGAAGLVHTTMAIIRDAKDKGYKSILILEDDIIFKSTVYEVTKQCLENLPEDWDMFHLTATNTKPPRRIGKHLHRLESAWSCQAYIVHERAYDEYLEWLAAVS